MPTDAIPHNGEAVLLGSEYGWVCDCDARSQRFWMNVVDAETDLQKHALGFPVAGPVKFKKPFWQRSHFWSKLDWGAIGVVCLVAFLCLLTAVFIAAGIYVAIRRP